MDSDTYHYCSHADLCLRFGHARRARPDTVPGHVSPEVYESYLKGKDELRKSNRPSCENSIAFFEDAIGKGVTSALCGVSL